MREKRHAARRAARTAVTSRFVVLTGLSGSGKSQAIRALEDLGYFCVDNLPVTLLPMLAELTLRAGSEIAPRRGRRRRPGREAAVGVPGDLPKRLKAMRNLNPVLIFLEASEPALVRRFSETRRPHPLAKDRSALEGIREERQAMRSIRRMADHVVDTSGMTVHELRHAFTGVASGQSRPGAQLTSRFSASASSTAFRSIPTCSSTSGSCRTRISSRRCGPTPAATATSSGTWSAPTRLATSSTTR